MFDFFCAYRWRVSVLSTCTGHMPVYGHVRLFRSGYVIDVLFCMSFVQLFNEKPFGFVRRKAVVGALIFSSFFFFISSIFCIGRGSKFVLVPLKHIQTCPLNVHTWTRNKCSQFITIKAKYIHLLCAVFLYYS